MPSVHDIFGGDLEDKTPEGKSVHFNANTEEVLKHDRSKERESFLPCGENVPAALAACANINADVFNISSSDSTASSICSGLSDMEENLKSMLLDNASESELNSELLSMTDLERQQRSRSKLEECERILNAIHSWLKKISVSLFKDDVNLHCEQCLIHCSSVIAKKTRFPVGRRLNLSKP